MPPAMTLLARTGRQRQRYDDDHCRLVAGCIPYRLKQSSEDHTMTLVDRLEVLMISSPNRDDLVFPKGGWEDDETVDQAACREALEEAGVRGIIHESHADVVVREAWFSLKYMIGDANGVEISDFFFHPFAFLCDKMKRKECLGRWEFRSKSRQSSCSLEGSCRGYMFALQVTVELDSWPEEACHKRKWLSVPEATKLCRYPWMREALEKCVKLLNQAALPASEPSFYLKPSEPECLNCALPHLLKLLC